MPSVGGKGKMAAYNSSRHRRLLNSRKRGQSFPSSARKMCYSQGVAVATEKVYRMIVQMVKCHMEDITKTSCIFAGKRKTLQVKDVEAALRRENVHIL